jgi:hypothetical protein
VDRSERSCVGAGQRLRIVEIRTELAPEMLEAGFSEIFVVERGLIYRRIRSDE